MSRIWRNFYCLCEWDKDAYNNQKKPGCYIYSAHRCCKFKKLVRSFDQNGKCDVASYWDESGNHQNHPNINQGQTAKIEKLRQYSHVK